MRPRVRSYGESSTATLSPARIRMKFLRILPETCAKTWCLFSSSTRNMAFGNGSITVAMTSMASSFGFPESPLSPFFFSSNCFAIFSCSTLSAHPLPRRPSHLFGACQNPRPVRGDRHRVLEVRRGTAVSRFRRPLVAHPHFRAPRVNHRLDSDHHAFLQPRAAPFFAVVRQVGLVVHPGTDAVPDKLPHHRKTILLDPSLHRMADIAQPVARAHFFNRAIQRVPGHFEQLLHLGTNFPERNSHRRVCVVAVDFHPEINRDDVALAQFPFRRRNPVHDLAVHRRA